MAEEEGNTGFVRFSTSDVSEESIDARCALSVYDTSLTNEDPQPLTKFNALLMVEAIDVAVKVLKRTQPLLAATFQIGGMKTLHEETQQSHICQ